MSSKRSPLDFYHQHLWKLQNDTDNGTETMYYCTRCTETLDTYEDVVTHCEEQDCEKKDGEPPWLKQ